VKLLHFAAILTQQQLTGRFVAQVISLDLLFKMVEYPQKLWRFSLTSLPDGRLILDTEPFGTRLKQVLAGYHFLVDFN
jgi:hypothetical protein